MASSGPGAHPLFGGADLAAAASKLKKTDTSDRSAPQSKAVPTSAPTTSSSGPPPPDARAKPLPKKTGPSGNSMADQVAMLAQQRSKRVAATGGGTADSSTEDNRPPPPAARAAAPTFAKAKLRKTTPSQETAAGSGTAAAAAGASAPYAQSQLRNTGGGVDTRAPPQQVHNEPEEQEAPPQPKAQPEPVYEETYTTSEPKYETTMISRTEPKVVRTERLVQHDPEYGTLASFFPSACCNVSLLVFFVDHFGTTHGNLMNSGSSFFRYSLFQRLSNTACVAIYSKVFLVC